MLPLDEHLTLLTNKQLGEVCEQFCKLSRSRRISEATRQALLSAAKSGCREMFMRIDPSHPEDMQKIWTKLEGDRPEAGKGTN